MYIKACEHVVQLSEKSKELKPPVQQAPPQKTFGRPARKEYPAFDINHHVAREYLARIKEGKNGIGGAKERPISGLEERHGAVDFQQPKEEYTPWKDVPVEEEKIEVPDDRPISWAEAARRKQNLANGISEKSQAPKGRRARISLHAIGMLMSYLRSCKTQASLQNVWK